MFFVKTAYLALLLYICLGSIEMLIIHLPLFAAYLALDYWDRKLAHEES